MKDYEKAGTVWTLENGSQGKIIAIELSTQLRQIYPAVNVLDLETIAGMLHLNPHTASDEQIVATFTSFMSKYPLEGSPSQIAIAHVNTPQTLNDIKKLITMHARPIVRLPSRDIGPTRLNIPRTQVFLEKAKCPYYYDNPEEYTTWVVSTVLRILTTQK